MSFKSDAQRKAVFAALRQKLKSLARSERKWAEQYGKKYGYPKDLQGLCHDASCRLASKFKARGMRAKVVMTPGHSFVRVGPYIVDVTATQFGGKRDKIGKINVRRIARLDQFPGYVWQMDRKLRRPPPWHAEEGRFSEVEIPARRSMKKRVPTNPLTWLNDPEEILHPYYLRKRKRKKR